MSFCGEHENKLKSGDGQQCSQSPKKLILGITLQTTHHNEQNNMYVLLYKPIHLYLVIIYFDTVVICNTIFWWNQTWLVPHWWSSWISNPQQKNNKIVKRTIQLSFVYSFGSNSEAIYNTEKQIFTKFKIIWIIPSRSGQNC